MMNLSEYRRSSTRLADYLPWVALVSEGVVLNKDGSIQRTAKFRGPDLDSAVAAELVAVAGRINNAVRRLGSGWAVFVEAQRDPSSSYPDSMFPDPASGLVDAERKAGFEEAGSHFVPRYYLTLLYLPPAEEAARAETWLYEGRGRAGVDPWEILRGFIDRTDRVLALFDGIMPECRWLDDAETLTFLHATISTSRHRVRVPETPVYLDALLADQPLTGGLEPRLGNAHLRILTITGFPTATTPGLLDDLNRLAFPYRWSTRAILMDKTDAARLLTKIRRQWFAKRKSIAAILKEVMTNEQSALVDTDAANKALDADMALQELGADVAGMAGFVLIPFGLFGKTAFMAERVLGNVVSSGIKVLVLAVIIGIGSTLFGEFTQGFDGATPTIDEAMAIVLAALSLLGLGIFGPGIATGIVSGGPQLSAGAAVGTGLAVGGAAVAAGGATMLAAKGGAAALSGGAAAVRGGAGATGAASTAYSLGAMGQSGVGGVASGLGGVARAAGSAAVSPLKRAASRASESVKSSHQSGARAAFAAGGGTSSMGTIGGAAAPGAAAAPGNPPAWAQNMRRSQAMSHGLTAAGHAVRSGDSGGGGSSISLSESDRT